MPRRLLVASKLLETWTFGALMMSCIVCKEENKLSPQLILKLNTSSAVWQKVCLIWTWNIEGKTENGWERKRDQFAKFYRNWFFWVQNFNLILLSFLFFLSIFQAEQSPLAALFTALDQSQKYPKIKISQNHLLLSQITQFSHLWKLQKFLIWFI